MKHESIRALIFRFLKNQSGAALIEYSILVGLITAGVITIVISVGAWVSQRWNLLETSLNST